MSNVYADTQTKTISDSSSFTLGPSIATNGDNIFVTWTHSLGIGASEVLFVKSTDGGNTFTTPKTLSTDRIESADSKIAVAGENIIVTWREHFEFDTSHILFVRSTDGGNTFSDPQKIDEDVAFSGAAEIATHGDNIFVVWNDIKRSDSGYDNIETYFSKSTDGGQTFDKPINISNSDGLSGNPHIATNGSEIFAAWADDLYGVSAVVVFSKSTDGGNTFSDPQNLINSKTYSGSPYIATNDSEIFVAWDSHEEGKVIDMYFSKSTDGAQTFTAPQNISHSSVDSISPDVVVDGNDVFITWTEAGAKSSKIFFSKSTDSGQTFTAPQNISADTGFSSTLSMTTDSETLFAVWNWSEHPQDNARETVFSKFNIDESSGIDSTEDSLSLDQSNQISSVNNTDFAEYEIQNYTAAIIEWDKHMSEIGDYGLLKITDPDMNVDPKRVDIFTAKAWSTTDPEGIDLDMIESGVNTSEFFIDVEFTTGNSGIQMLKTSNGDVVTALYHDNTIPDKFGASMDLTDTINISGKPIYPLQQLEQGTPIDEITCIDELHSLFVNGDAPLCLSSSTHAKLVARGYFD